MLADEKGHLEEAGHGNIVTSSFHPQPTIVKHFKRHTVAVAVCWLAAFGSFLGGFSYSGDSHEELTKNIEKVTGSVKKLSDLASLVVR